MTDFDFPLFNEKPLFHTAASYRRDGGAARRRLARFLAATCANDAPDDAQAGQQAPEPQGERRAATRD